MKRMAAVGSVVALTIGVALCYAQEGPQMPPPEKEHAWLQQLAGEWEAEFEMEMEPGKPKVKSKWTETARLLGGFWLVASGTGMMGDKPMASSLTLGFNPKTKRYIGTWVDSTNSHMWHYDGSVDATGKILALDADGPDFNNPDKTAKYRDTFEIKSADHKILTSSAQGPDGKWTTFLTVDYKRKK